LKIVCQYLKQAKETGIYRCRTNSFSPTKKHPQVGQDQRS